VDIFPLTNPQPTPSVANFQTYGNQLTLFNSEEVPLESADNKVGIPLPQEMLIGELSPDLLELKAYGGGFHQNESHADDNVTSVKTRIELYFNYILGGELSGSRLTTIFEYTDDYYRCSCHEMVARLRIPFGLSGSSGYQLRSWLPLTRQEKRMWEGGNATPILLPVLPDQKLWKVSLWESSYTRSIWLIIRTIWKMLFTTTRTV